MRPVIVVVMLLVAACRGGDDPKTAAADAKPGTAQTAATVENKTPTKPRVLLEDDLLGRWSTNETTDERMNDYNVGAGIPKHIETSKGGPFSFIVVRRGRYMFRLSADNKTDNKGVSPLSLKRGSHGELVDTSDVMRVTFSLVGDRLKVVDRLDGSMGGSTTGIYTRVAPTATVSGNADPLRPLQASADYKPFRAVFGLDRVQVICHVDNPNGMAVMVHVVGQFVTANRGTREGEDDIAIPARSKRDRSFTFEKIDLGRAGSVHPQCVVTSNDGLTVNGE
jgi:hypothetical protein